MLLLFILSQMHAACYVLGAVLGSGCKDGIRWQSLTFLGKYESGGNNYKTRFYTYLFNYSDDKHKYMYMRYQDTSSHTKIREGK